ncbi:MAG: hypothetical protein PHP44_08170 [Kiritimatiellae bacterium]|nr:hypothetical protein [Kiritimatiellia bacterium]MDD4736066.1 hypothetical protein [Kiritimatiellia bacterium]
MKKLGIASLLMAALAISASADLLNGSFTVGDGEWTMSSAAISMLDWGGSDVRSAGGSLVSSYFNGGDSWGGHARQVLSVDAGSYYDFSLWYQEDASFNGTPYAAIEWADGSGTWSDKIEVTITRPGAKTWTESTEIGMLAPVYATQARVEIGYVGESFTDVGFFDDASFTTSAVPEPVSATLLGLGIFAIYAVRRKFRG